MPDAASTFSTGSQDYARVRPGYPPELIDWILSHCPAREAAWDCATGTGQAALALAGRFDRVEATDISGEQLAAAPRRENIVYSVQPAERTGFADASFDLVTVAQALHWFDLDAFWREVRRVARPGALFAAWGYGWARCDPAIDEALIQPVRGIVDPFWAERNAMLWRGYPSGEIGFPFERIDPPRLVIEGQYTIDEAVTLIHTWSAYKRAITQPRLAAELAAIERAARASLGDHSFSFESDIFIAAGRVS